VIVPRAWDITAPFIRPFDTAFQEALALSHLEYGLGVTSGIAGFCLFNGQFLYHAAHPPLLQLMYAGLYALFGVSEWVSRAFCALMALGTALCLWAAMIKTGTRKAAFWAALFFAAITLSVEMGRTTNYEPGALFFISLFLLGYTMRANRRGIALMTVAVFIGGFFEWTVYLALPAVAVAALIEQRVARAKRSLPVKNTGKPSRLRQWHPIPARTFRNLKFLLAPSIAAAVALVTVFSWQKAVVGVIPVVSHASTRSDPRAIFDIAAWLEAISYPLRGVGLGWLVVAFGIYRIRTTYRNAPRATGLLIAYLATPVFFFLLAPQLVLTHPLASLYIIAPVAMLLGISAEGTKPKIMFALLGLLLVYYLANDALVIRNRAPFFYNLSRVVAKRIEANPGCKAYDSTAIGYLRYYHNVETFHAVGANEPPVEEFIDNKDVCVFIQDVANPEVGYVRDAVNHAAKDGKIGLAWKLHGVEVWVRGAGVGTVILTNLLDRAEAPPSSGRWWERPAADIIEVGAELKYGISHHARRDGNSVIRFTDIAAPVGAVFETVARLKPGVCNPARTDGVGFKVTVSSDQWSKSVEGQIIPDKKGCKPVSVKIDIETGVDKVSVELTVKARQNAAFDRFFWENPRIVPPGGE